MSKIKNITDKFTTAKITKAPENIARIPRAAIVTSTKPRIVAKQTPLSKVKQQSPKIDDRQISSVALAPSSSFNSTVDPTDNSTNKPAPNPEDTVNNQLAGDSSTPAMPADPQSEKRKPPVWRSNTAKATIPDIPYKSPYAARGYKRRAQLKNIRTVEPSNNSKISTAIETPNEKILAESSVQTDESEILDNDSIVGEVKVLLPSCVIVAEIDRKRALAKQKELLKATRKFEEHSLRQEQHINDLTEFLDKSAITKRIRQPKVEEVVPIYPMDKRSKRNVTRTTHKLSSDERIRAKEIELLSLFDSYGYVNEN